ncbi:GNAT family N-acetyltransferase [Acidimangrovimonas sediminis]|uniref:GNAT family N-acetyltransferase n=1 Tax=Acidimangrovimonas sediminis TaxID=2056283 RepID=UPI000C80DEAB|nr:GNAT family N-acetyltransferase [Acidimangrovimonas sediminis]
MTPAIRTASRADLTAIDALLSRSYGRQLAMAYPPSLVVMAVPILSRAQPRLIGSGTYYVAEEAGMIVGAGGWTRGVFPGFAHVRHVVTDAGRGRSGIGRAVLEHGFATARAAGMTRLACMATLNAEGFYARLGFRSLGRISVPLGPGIDFPAVRMEKRLDRD